ncbi:hypothetical protein HPB48_021889 [Haemaphysalis longicornis]|uniref:Uncharacterized protein n=1 Tax=Haemaphysalis longicornis TaxID=44386 RepID=A0A9J6GBF7_HAELO|nr:hypothetical protein HPB48_021889 [Haemaphysalis longicornis]
MSATGNAAVTRTCNASVAASVSAVDSAVEKRAQQEEQEEEGAAPPPAVIVDPEHEDADLIPSQDFVRMIKYASPGVAVRKRQDVINQDNYYNLIRMTNAEQHELLREIIHRQTTPFSTSVTGLLDGTGLMRRRSSSGLPWTSTTGTATPATTPPTTRSSSARALERRLWQWEEPRCTRLSSSLGRPTGPNKGGGLSASELNTFRVGFRNVKCKIIDKANMMSADNLNVVDLSRPHRSFAYYSGLPYGSMVNFFVCILPHCSSA